MSDYWTSVPIAILGCGSIGSRHLRNLVELGCENICVYDPTADARNHATLLGAHTCVQTSQVWERLPQIVFICTPSNLHVEHAAAAANHSAHLFIEKPVAHTLDGVQDLARTTEDQRLTTLVGCNMRFHPGLQQLKSLLLAECIGPVLAARLHTGSYLPRWRPQQDYRNSYSASPSWGGALLDCIHEIDLALWLFGPATLAASVTRPASSIGLQTDGLAELLLEHHDGVLTSLHLNFVQRNYRRSIEVIGADGSLCWDFNAEVVSHFGPNGNLVQRFHQADDWQLNQMYRDEIEYFLCCVRDGLPTFNSVSNAAATLRIALQAKKHKTKGTPDRGTPDRGTPDRGTPE